MRFPFFPPFLDVAFLATLIPTVHAQGGKPVDWQNHFIWPPLPGPPSNVDPNVYKSNPVFEVGKTLDRPFTWVSNIKNMRILMLQEGAPYSEGAAQYLFRACGGNYANNATNLHYFDGRVGTIDISVSNVVFLGAYDCDVPGSAPVFFSHYFNLTKSTKSTTTITLQTSSTLIPAPTSVPATQTPDSAASAGATMESGASNDSSVAIMADGIGGGIGGAIVLVAAVFGFWKYRNGKKQEQLRQSGVGAEDGNNYRGGQGTSTMYEHGGCRSPPMYEVAGSARHEGGSMSYKYQDSRDNSPPPQQMEAPQRPVEMYSGGWGRHNAVEM